MDNKMYKIVVSIFSAPFIYGLLYNSIGRYFFGKGDDVGFGIAMMVVVFGVPSIVISVARLLHYSKEKESKIFYIVNLVVIFGLLMFWLVFNELAYR